MPKRPNQKGFSRFDFRPGVGEFPRWRGLNLNDDPATIDGNQFWDAINMRLDGGTINNRGGQTKANTVATTGCVYGIYEVEGGVESAAEDSIPAFYCMGALKPGARVAQDPITSSGAGGVQFVNGIPLLGAFNSDPNTFTSGISAAGQALKQVVALGIRWDLYSGTPPYNNLYAGSLFPPKESGCRWGSGSSVLGLAKLQRGAGDKILSFGGTDVGINTGNVYEITNNAVAVNSRLLFNCGSMLSDGISRSERIIDATVGVDDIYDVLYLSTFTAGKLFRYDTVRGLVTLSSSLPVNRTAIGIYRENVYVSGSNAANALYRVNADYTVTALGNPAVGYTGPFIPSGMKQYKDNLYISGWDMGVGLGTGILLKWDGTTLTVVAGVPGGGDLCVYNNFLYIGSGDVVVSDEGGPNEGQPTTFAKWDGTTRTVQLNIQTFLDTTYVAGSGGAVNAGHLTLKEFKMTSSGDSSLVLAVLGSLQGDGSKDGWLSNYLVCVGTDTTASGNWTMLSQVWPAGVGDDTGNVVYGTVLMA